MTEEEAVQKQQDEAQQYVANFMTALSVDEDVAAVLVEEGFTTVEEVAYVPIEELSAIDGFDEEIVDELRNRAKDAMLTRAIASEEQRDGNEPQEDLLTMQGMTDELARSMAAAGVTSMEDLAELAIPELIEIVEGLDEDEAADLIMTARAPWFEETDVKEPT